MPIDPIIGGAALGIGTNLINNAINSNQNAQYTKRQMRANMTMMDYQQKKQMENWEATGYGAQKEQMQKAGINPALMYGQGGGGGQSMGNVSSGNVDVAPMKGGMDIGGTIAAMQQNRIMEAQTELMRTQAEKNRVETKKISGVDTESVSTQTANMRQNTKNAILDGIIKKYTGLEAKDQYERINKPLRGIEMKTKMNEYEARQGIAETIYDLWGSGQLENKANAEIEGMLLKNAKTREERREIEAKIDILEANLKGVNLDNVIKELETKMQTKLGIDKDSPDWARTLGRLILKLTE